MISVICAYKSIANNLLKPTKLPLISYYDVLSFIIGTMLKLNKANPAA